MRWFDRAMFLDEYLGNGVTSVAADAEPVDLAPLLERWRATCGDGSQSRLAHRLSALGLDPASAADALQPRVFDHVPTWAQTALDIGRMAPALIGEIDRSDDEAVPFASLYLPWMRFGLERLGQRTPVPAALRESLAEMLRSRLRSCGEPVVLDEFRRSGMSYRRWIEHQHEASLTPLYEALPVWARLLATATLDWIDALADFLTHLHDDAEIVRRLVGDDSTPASVDQAGDPHHGGRQVVIVTTSSNRRIVYKPRSLAPEVLARAVSDHLRANGATDVDLVGAVVDCGDHGWMEWIDTVRPTAAQMSRYSFNAGVALALAHRLAIADLHFENLLPAGDHPVLVDLECLGNTRPKTYASAGASTGAPEREDVLARSVLTTYMLVSVTNHEREGRDDSGLTGILEAAEAEEEASCRWVGLGTDEIDLVRQRVRSRCDDEPVMLDVEQVIAGLDLGQRTIDEHGLGVDVDTPIDVRVIAQTTASYAMLLARVARRAALSSGLRFSIELDEVTRPGTDPRAAAWRLGACEVERRDLQRLDIPLFTVPLNSTCGRVGSYAIPALVDESGTAAIEARGRDASPQFHRLQRDVTRLLLEQRLALAGRTPQSVTSVLRSSPADPLAVCEAIAADLEERAIPDDDGGLTWLDIEVLGRFPRPVVTDSGLMSDSGGVGLFLAGLANTTGRDRWAELARATLAGDPPVDGTSLSHGASGRGYALATAGMLLDDGDLVQRGLKLLSQVPPPAELTDVDPLDLLVGVPGIAAALAAGATMCADPGLAERATACLHHSRSAWKEAATGADPQRRIAATRIGVAHGTTGIELAVARVIEARGATGLDPDPELAAWLTELIACENDRIDQRDGIPARLGPVTREPDAGWCWGASGFVVARRSIATITGHADAERGLDRGEEVAATSVASFDRACCGVASQVLALDGAGAEPLVAGLLERRGRWVFEADSPFQGVSLLRGGAGLGLTLLRHVHPHAVPNPLVVEPVLPTT